MEPTDWDALIRPHVEGRPVILAGGPLAGWTTRVGELRRLGAERVLVMATGSVGTGPLPPEGSCEWFVVDAGAAASMMEHIRLELAVLAEPPPDAAARLDAFDPAREALVLGDFLNTAPELAGRAFLAHRRPEWVALEDKVVVDGFWDRAGVRRAPSEIVPADRAAVAAAAARLDAGGGVVVAGDAREGFNGGASLVRWADGDERLGAAVGAIAPHSDRVRVMPYLPGIPCSVHGIVMDDGVAVLRPVEMVVLRRPDGSFFYAGCATFYDPPSAIRDEMRAVARRTAARLRAEVAFRGAFTVDGVATADGFLPTELNPRSGAGLTVMARAAGVPLQFVLDLVVAGRPVGLGAAALEAELLERFDAGRTGGTWARVGTEEGSPTEVALAWRGGEVVEAGASDETVATLTIGPAGGARFVRTVFDPGRTPVGPSVGERAAAVWRFADSRFGLALGELHPATAAA